LLEKGKHIDDLFADYLGDYEEKAPGYVWQNVQMDLKRGKARKKAAIIRAMAASIALLCAFGLGYYFSDFSRYQLSAISNKKIVPRQEGFENKSKMKSGRGKQDLSLNKKSQTDGYSVRQSEMKDDFDSSKTLLTKLMERKQKSFSFYRNNSFSNFDKKTIYKKYSGKKTSNQLLIDTLLFKKENLSERGFLLPKKRNYQRWSFGTRFSPVYSMAENMEQTSLTNMPMTKSASEAPDTKAEEKPLMSFSGGFNINYSFTKRWSIESGLFYSQYRQKAQNLVGSSIYGLQNELTVYTPEGIRYLQQSLIEAPGTSQIIGQSMDETYYTLDMDYKSNYEYIEFPLIVRYKIIDRKFGLDVLSGISTNILVGNKSSIIYNDNDLWTGTTDGISPLLYNATFGLGLNYNLFQNLSLNIEPTFKYSISPDESTTLLKYPYKFAVFAGFSFKF
jgi:hypothetical protein